MRKLLLLLSFMALAINVSAQNGNALDQLKADPRKAYGNDYPYPHYIVDLTKAPDGYRPFYISHYARHGSRYYWNAFLYQELDSLLSKAHKMQVLTPEGEGFYEKFMAAKDELKTGVSELTQLGWEQHQKIARTMYNNFPEVFEKGGNVLAISSLTGRCVLSMSAFCQELVQCNPAIEVREQSSRFTLDGVVPTDRQNPKRRDYPKSTPKWESHRDQFHYEDHLGEKVLARVFKTTEGLPGNMHHVASNLINLYTSLPSIGHDGMMGNIITDQEIADRWEMTNLGSYSWVFGPRYDMIPILRDILAKADAVINGTSDHIADLRFGHDTVILPLFCLMGINGYDLATDNLDELEAKGWWCSSIFPMGANLQFIFYRSNPKDQDVLVKVLLNEQEATLPIATDCAPYYHWTDFRRYCMEKLEK